MLLEPNKGSISLMILSFSGALACAFGGYLLNFPIVIGTPFYLSPLIIGLIVGFIGGVICGGPIWFTLKEYKPKLSAMLLTKIILGVGSSYIFAALLLLFIIITGEENHPMGPGG